MLAMLRNFGMTAQRFLRCAAQSLMPSQLASFADSTATVMARKGKGKGYDPGARLRHHTVSGWCDGFVSCP